MKRRQGILILSLSKLLNAGVERSVSKHWERREEWRTRQQEKEQSEVSSIHTSSLIHHHLHAKDAAAGFHEFAGVYFDGVETVFLQCRD